MFIKETGKVKCAMENFAARIFSASIERLYSIV